jgi:hypothetical protein
MVHNLNENRVCSLLRVHYGVPSARMDLIEVLAVLLEHLLEVLQVTHQLLSSLLHAFGNLATGNSGGVSMETLLANNLAREHERKHGSELPILQLFSSGERCLDVLLGDGRQFDGRYWQCLVQGGGLVGQKHLVVVLQAGRDDDKTE